MLSKLLKKYNLTAEKFDELQRQHTDVEIAQMYGKTTKTIILWRKEFKLDSLTPEERREAKQEPGTLRFSEITKPQLVTLCQTHTNDEIAQMYGVSKFTVQDKRAPDMWNIPALWHGRRPTKTTTTNATQPSAQPEPGHTESIQPPSIPQVHTIPCSGGCGTMLTCAYKHGRTRMCDECTKTQQRLHKQEVRALLPPVEKKTTRNMTCSQCSRTYISGIGGRSTKCPECVSDVLEQAVAADKARRTKKCAYAPCGKVFFDDNPKPTRKYCTPDCQHKEKVTREDRVPAGGFLSDRVKLCEAVGCNNEFTPAVDGQKYCSNTCRKSSWVTPSDTRRNKTCRWCQKPFTDTSLKINQQGHPECSQQHNTSGKSVNNQMPSVPSKTIDTRRKYRERRGEGGRLDDITSKDKFDSSWWGRVSELIFAKYYPGSTDLNILHAQPPYDFNHPTLNRVDVKGSKESYTAHGKAKWTVEVTGVGAVCDHVFIIGYNRTQTAIEHLWLIPTTELNARSVVLSPTSKEYRGTRWEVTKRLGTGIGDDLLTEFRSLPDPIRALTTTEWALNRDNFTGDSKAHRGRRAEFLYQDRYLDSKDQNALVGWNHPFDFEDADGIRVNVKSSMLHLRTDRPNSNRKLWGFTLVTNVQEEAGHQCDLYSCLCLDEHDERIIMREYRIPVSVLIGQNTVNIYDDNEFGWSQYRVLNPPDNLNHLFDDLDVVK